MAAPSRRFDSRTARSSAPLIAVDCRELAREIKSYLEQVSPELVDRVKLYTGATPLFDEREIEEQIHRAYRREVDLASGGHIVIEATGKFRKIAEIKIDKTVAVAAGDVNGDKRADIYVVRGGTDLNRADRLFVNNGNGTLTNLDTGTIRIGSGIAASTSVDATFENHGVFDVQSDVLASRRFRNHGLLTGGRCRPTTNSAHANPVRSASLYVRDSDG